MLATHSKGINFKKDVFYEFMKANQIPELKRKQIKYCKQNLYLDARRYVD